MNDIPKKKIHNGKTRIIEGNTENEKICEKIKTQIDKMEKLMSDKQIVSSLRYSLKGQSSLPKTKYDDVMNDTKIISKEDTSYGNLTILSTISSSSKTVPIVTQAIEIMGIDIDDIYREPKSERKLNVNTNGLKTMVNDEATVDRLKEIYKESPLWTEDESGWIAYRLEVIKELTSNHLKYNYYYNRAKDVFKQATENGSFPTSFVYKGVSFGWENITKKPSLYDCVMGFIIENHPDRVDEFNACIIQTRNLQKKYTLVYLLDDIDYIMGINI